MRLDKSDAVEFARQRASVLGLNFKVTAKASTRIDRDLTKIANSKVTKTDCSARHSLIIANPCISAARSSHPGLEQG